MEMIIAVGVLGVMGYFAASLFQTSLKGSVQSNILVQADTAKRNMINILSNESSWFNTIRANPSLSCLLPLTENTPGPATCENEYTATNIVLKDGGPSGGTTVFNFSSSTSGLTNSGQACNEYTASGNDKCPLQFKLTVRIVCGESCGNPQVNFNAVAAYSARDPSLKTSFNPAKYGFNFFRNQGGESLQAACAMLGGTFEVGPPVQCNIAPRICETLGGTLDAAAGTCSTINVPTIHAQQIKANGEVQVGYSGAACAAEKSGALRFNPANKRLELCDGSAWVSASQERTGMVCGLEGSGCEGGSGSGESMNCPTGFSLAYFSFDNADHNRDGTNSQIVKIYYCVKN